MTGRRTVRRTFVVLAFAVGAALAVGCSGDEGAGGGSGRATLTVVLEWSPNTNHGGIYLARERGWYRDAGLDVKVVEPGDTSSLQLLGAGKADIAVSVQEDLVAARAEGVPVVSIAAVVQHNTSSLVSLRSSGISRPRDLAGHTYGGFGGPLEQALVKALAACDGGDPEEVRFVDVGNADYRVGLTRDQYDVVWIFDGWDGIRLGEIDALPLDRIAFRDHLDCIPDWYTPLLATSESSIARRAGVLERFVEATARGYREAAADPAASADALLEAAPELDRELVERSARYLSGRYAEDPTRWGHQERDVWTRFVGFLDAEGIIPEPIDVEAAYTNRFLPNER